MAPPQKKFKSSQTPAQMPLLKAKVISVRNTQRVRHWTIGVDEARPDNIYVNTVAAVSDGHAAYKFTLYKELAAQVQVGKSYIFKEYSTAKFGDQSLLCTPTTKIYMCADVLVPEELEEEARILIRPPSPMTSLSDMTVPSDYMTVQGSITRLDPVQAVTPAQGQPYPMRSLYLKEADTETKVILWREANIAHLEVGMPVMCSHMLAKNVPPYGMAIHSTSHTEVQLFSGLVDIEVLGVSVQKEDIEFLDTREIPRVIRESVWASSFDRSAVTAVGTKITLYSSKRPVTSCASPCTCPCFLFVWNCALLFY